MSLVCTYCVSIHIHPVSLPKILLWYVDVFIMFDIHWFHFEGALRQRTSLFVLLGSAFLLFQLSLVVGCGKSTTIHSFERTWSILDYSRTAILIHIMQSATGIQYWWSMYIYILYPYIIYHVYYYLVPSLLIDVHRCRFLIAKIQPGWLCRASPAVARRGEWHVLRAPGLDVWLTRAEQCGMGTHDSWDENSWMMNWWNSH